MTNLMTMAEFAELSKTRGTWAVYVTASGFGLCDCGVPHGTKHQHLHSRGLNQRHAERIAKNWTEGGYAAVAKDESENNKNERGGKS